jgi:hypothetical protein
MKGKTFKTLAGLGTDDIRENLVGENVGETQ